MALTEELQALSDNNFLGRYFMDYYMMDEAGAAAYNAEIQRRGLRVTAWFIKEPDQAEAGPFTREELLAKAGAGAIRAGTLVRHASRKNWYAVENVAGLGVVVTPETAAETQDRITGAQKLTPFKLATAFILADIALWTVIAVIQLIESGFFLGGWNLVMTAIAVLSFRGFRNLRRRPFQNIWGSALVTAGLNIFIMSLSGFNFVSLGIVLLSLTTAILVLRLWNLFPAAISNATIYI